MRIDAPKGTRVMFTNPDAGYLSDQEHAQQYLREGRAYTIARTVIDPWCTHVELVEVPGVGFNSVLFDEVAVRAGDEDRTGYGDDG